MVEFGMKKVLLFDIDYTLLDSGIIKTKTIDEICRVFEVDRLKVEAARDKYYFSLASTTDIKPDEMLGVIQRELGVPLTELKSTYYNPKIYEQSVYPETIEMLMSIDLDKFVLGVFSEGWDYYQKFKMEASGIAKYFDNKFYFIKRRKKSNEFINSLPRDSWVIDDRADVVKKLKKVGGVVPIWINRKDKQTNPEIKTIFSLKELLSVVNETI